jgi:hypothetical protein
VPPDVPPVGVDGEVIGDAPDCIVAEGELEPELDRAVVEIIVGDDA